MPTPTLTDHERVIVNQLAEYLIGPGNGTMGSAASRIARFVAAGERTYRPTDLILNAGLSHLRTLNQTQFREFCNSFGWGETILRDTSAALGVNAPNECIGCHRPMRTHLLCGDCVIHRLTSE